MRSALLLLLVLLALAALTALLWWRFRGRGQPAAPVPGPATRNHHSLRSFHYEPAAAAQPPAQPPPTAEDGSQARQDPPTQAAPRPAAGALSSLLDVLDEPSSSAARPAEPAPEDEEEPAPSLFHNPITAPAPTANDKANRAAQIALRQQQRARVSAGAGAQRAALHSLFPGAGSPVPTAQPS